VGQDLSAEACPPAANAGSTPPPAPLSQRDGGYCTMAPPPRPWVVGQGRDFKIQARPNHFEELRMRGGPPTAPHPTPNALSSGIKSMVRA